MIELQEPRLSEDSPCPYLEGKTFRQEYFFAHDLTAEEFQKYLESGWRRFGLFFFRPRCPACRECKPIRIKAREFQPGKSQRRIRRKNKGTEVLLRPPSFREEIFQLYLAHRKKFPDRKEDEDRETFIRSYFQPAVPTFLSVYTHQGHLAGTGFLDQGVDGLSSVYFCYHPDVAHLGLGTFSIMKEIELVHQLGMDYYYLGYYIADCNRMNYKGKFHPAQIMDWDSGNWEDWPE